MHVKRFEGPTMNEALQKVREELGPDALVLSSRNRERGSGRFGLFGSPVVEVVAAVDRDALREESPREGARPRTTADPSWAELGLSRALIEPLEQELGAVRTLVERIAGAPPAEVSLAAEVAELRQLARDLGKRKEREEASRASGCCLAAGLAPRHAGTLASESEQEVRRGADDVTALELVLAVRIDRQIRAARDDDPPIQLLVGPTGAGKTTTLAKVANRLPQSDGLAVISTDVHRAGAAEPLRQLARELDVTFVGARSPESVMRALDNLDARRALIDTAGASPGDAEAHAELVRLREALGSRAGVQLVLPATTKESDLRAALRRYRPLDPEALVVTKMDESDDLSNVLNVLLDEAAPPLQWLGNGQRVPEDLVIPDPLSLAERALGLHP